MKKIVLFGLFAFALAVNPAYALRIDLASTAGLGASVATYSDTTTSCQGCPNPYTLTIDAEVFLSGGVYSYVYAMSTTATSPAVEIVTVESDGFPSTFSLNLLPFFNYGVIGLGDAASLVIATSNNNLTFFFDEAGLTVGNPLTVYVQTDLPPALAAFFGQDGGQAGGADTLAPAVPDSGSTLAFLGLALLGVAVAQKMMLS